MNLNIVENCQRLKHEVITNWKTGVVMTGVTVVVGQIYGKVAVGFVLLLTVSNYDMVGRQIRIISWMSLKRTFFIVVMFGGNGYFNLISPQLISYAAAAMLLIDNFQIAGINHELSTQNETLTANNVKLQKAYEGLKKLEEALNKLVKPVSEHQTAMDENIEKVQVIVEMVSEQVQDLPMRLQNVNTLLTELLGKTQLKDLIELEATLHADMRKVLHEVNSKLQLLTEKAEAQISNLATIALDYEKIVRENHTDLLNTKQIVGQAIKQFT